MTDYQSGPKSLEFLSFTTATIANGNGYSGGQLFEGVANGNTKQVYIDNSDNDKCIVLLTPNVASSGQVYSGAVANPTEDTQGDAATIQTVSTGGNGFGADLRTAGDGETGVLSGGESYPQVTIGGGSAARGPASGVVSNGAQISGIVESGDFWAIEATNVSGNTQDISITLTIAEVEASVLE